MPRRLTAVLPVLTAPALLAPALLAPASRAYEGAAVGAAVGAVAALLVAALALARLRVLRRSFAVLEAPDGSRQTFLAAVDRHIAEVDRLRGELARARGELDTARIDLADAIRHVSVVRYDAFADMGGRMSFSAALLDDAGDGLVLTSINGRTETRTYAKGVKAGHSEHALSPEELQAIDFARRGSAR